MKEGDYVIMAWRAPCGSCRFCAVGNLISVPHQLNAQPRMKTLDGKMLTPILGIGTFCTHTVVHSQQCIPIVGRFAARADEPDRVWGDDRRRRGALFGQGAARTIGRGHRLRRRWRLRDHGGEARRRDDDHRGRSRSSKARMGEGVRRNAHRQSATMATRLR